jgi:redox-sensitive bicupin YhaK (pirin superfamily)
MFPLLDPNGPNTLELFQIWLNLPAKNKLVPPYFTMFWDKDIPRRRYTDDNGRTTDVTVIAGALDGAMPLTPPPDSWASSPEADLAIWSMAMAPGATWVVPPAQDARTARTLHFFAGSGLRVAGRVLEQPSAIRVHSDQPVPLEAATTAVEILLLQGRPIAEPVAQHGPFVMNTRAQLEQAFADYQRTQFGGWPFPVNAPVHPRDAGRFARHADGREERV